MEPTNLSPSLPGDEVYASDAMESKPEASLTKATLAVDIFNRLITISPSHSPSQTKKLPAGAVEPEASTVSIRDTHV